MKRLAIFGMCFAASFAARGEDLRFAWNPNPEADQVTHYTLYKDGVALVSTQQTSITAPAEPGDSFTLTASNEHGESDPAGPIVIAASLAPPLDMAGATIHAFSSQETQGEDGRAVNAIDGDLGTFWHSRWSDGEAITDEFWQSDWQSAAAMPPHYIAIKLPRAAMASVLWYWPRQDGEANGNIVSYQVETSLDGAAWAETAAGQWHADANPKYAQLAYGEARYVRLWTTDQFATVAKLAIGGTWVPDPPASIPVTFAESTDLIDWSEILRLDRPHGRRFFRIGVGDEIHTYEIKPLEK